ncbi:MAG: hypothetical protein K0U98_02385 [Deltaproteobacteria bacterium]|nr:hypothetical protein [Deltaproteobacteria bacterium]
MEFKSSVIDSLAHEVEICKHLYTKIPEGQMGFRLGEGMRSTLDLLRYLTFGPLFPAYGMIKDDWKGAQEIADHSKKMAAEDFPAQMDRQMETLRQLINGLEDEDLDREVNLPWGAQGALGPLLVNLTVKFMTAYRMQLFLQAKASGATQLNTMNNWAGRDTPST